jgi:hypothetical protein
MKGRDMRALNLQAILLSCALLISRESWACSCAPGHSAEDVLERSEAVFTGVVRAVKRLPSGSSVATFMVVESFKGPFAGSLVRVRFRNAPSVSCGVTFTQGETYTLSASSDDEGRLTTSNCGTWMFQPNIPSSRTLIRRLREMRDAK